MTSSSPKTPGEINQSWNVPGIRNIPHYSKKNKSYGNSQIAPTANRNHTLIRNQVRDFFNPKTPAGPPSHATRPANNGTNNDNNNEEDEPFSAREERLRKSLDSRDKELQGMQDVMSDMQKKNELQMSKMKDKLKEVERELTIHKREAEKDAREQNAILQAELRAKQAELREKEAELERATANQYTQYRTAYNDSLFSLNQSTGLGFPTYNAPPVLPFINPNNCNLTSTTVGGARRKTPEAGPSTAPTTTQSETISNSMIENFNNIGMQNKSNIQSGLDVEDEIHLTPPRNNNNSENLEIERAELQKILNRSRENRQNPFASTDESETEVYFNSNEPVVDFDEDMENHLSLLWEGGQQTIGALAGIHLWFKRMNFEENDEVRDNSTIDSLATVLVQLTKVISGGHQLIEAKTEATRLGKDIYKQWRKMEKLGNRKYTEARQKQLKDNVNSFKEAGFAETSQDKTNEESTFDSNPKSDTIPEKEDHSGKNPFDEEGTN